MTDPSELTLLLLRLGFLLVLWLFVFGIVYALRSDLFGQRVRKIPAEAAPADTAPRRPSPATSPAAAPPMAPPAPPAGAPGDTQPATVHTANRLVITSGSTAGTEIPLGRDPLTIGRSSESSLVIRDDYTSTHHARLLIWNDDWMIQDLDSTNGTYLNGRRVGAPTQIPLNTPVKIGATTFELRR